MAEGLASVAKSRRRNAIATSYLEGLTVRPSSRSDLFTLFTLRLGFRGILSSADSCGTPVHYRGAFRKPSIRFTFVRRGA